MMILSNFVFDLFLWRGPQSLVERMSASCPSDLSYPAKYFRSSCERKRRLEIYLCTPWLQENRTANKSLTFHYRIYPEHCPDNFQTAKKCTAKQACDEFLENHLAANTRSARVKEVISRLNEEEVNLEVRGAVAAPPKSRRELFWARTVQVCCWICQRYHLCPFSKISWVTGL